MNSKTTNRTGTHAMAFRISEAQYQSFVALLENIPGSDVGNLCREIFARGLNDLATYYEKHMSRTREEVAAELEEEP